MPTRLKVFNLIFLSVGILLLYFGASATASRLRLKHDGLTAPGRVIHLQPRSGRHGASYYPVVQFVTQDGQEITFTGNSGSRPPAFHVDEAVTVLYDPENPHDAYIQTFMQFWGGPVIFLGIGLLFAAVPSGMLLSQVRSLSRVRWLKQYGRRISTQFQSVERITNIRVGGNNPYRIVSRWQDPVTNQHYAFCSSNLWVDPTPFIGNRTIDVLIDPNNPDRYWLDTDFLGDLVK